MDSRFRRGDRVRIVSKNHEYTGCRGTIADDPEAAGPGVSVLGHHVAIDGENGQVRPFLVSDLQPLRALRARASRGNAKAEPSKARPSSD